MPVILQVLDFPTDSGSSDDDLVKDIMAKLKKQGQQSGETVARVFAVSKNLNNESSNADRRKVTALMFCFALSLKLHYRSICYWLKNVLPCGLPVEAPSVAAAGLESHSGGSSNRDSNGCPSGCQGAECYHPEGKRAWLLCCGNVPNPHLRSTYALMCSKTENS